MSIPGKCAAWRCENEADWRDPANAQYGFCRFHARPEHFWPVSPWAYQEIHRG
jgi:hypothetical protein